MPELVQEPLNNPVQEKLHCYICELLFPKEELSTYDTNDDEKVCEECLQDALRCDNCNGLQHRNDFCFPHDEPYCQGCYDEYFTECYDCGEPEHNDEVIYVEYSESCVCQNCYDNYYWCESCDTDHHTDHRCPRDSGFIRNYSWTPDKYYIHSHPANSAKYSYQSEYGVPTFGFELEIDKGRDRSELAEILDSKYNGFLYYKEDGSLNSGFEIVSHPFTYKWYKEKCIKKDYLARLFRECKQYGFRSYDTNTCGMHTHISLKSFSDIHLYKFQKFYFHNKNLMEYIARRKQDNLERWANIDSGTSNIPAIIRRTKHKDSAKYLGVHIKPPHSVEVRIFRGTLIPKSFYSNLEFVMASYEFTKQASMKKVRDIDFMKWLNNEYSFTHIKDLIKRY